MTRRSEAREEMNIVPCKPLQPFGSRPKGPYHYIQVEFGRLELDIKTLDEAVKIFAREAMPASGIGTFIQTRAGVLVLGHQDPPGGRQWFGLKYAFDLLRHQEYVDPLELELAEMEAKRYADALNG